MLAVGRVLDLKDNLISYFTFYKLVSKKHNYIHSILWEVTCIHIMRRWFKQFLQKNAIA